MKWVIVRDDDANATTPVEWLQACVAPFVNRGLPVQVAAIPEVSTDIRLANGQLEGFLAGPLAGTPGTIPITTNTKLLQFLREQPLITVVQHGLSHRIIAGRFEFDEPDPTKVARWLDRGTRCVLDAQLGKPTTFVAPQDTLSKQGLKEVERRFPNYSTGWFERSRLPKTMWPNWIKSRVMGPQTVWRSGNLTLFSHPGCQLSRQKPAEGMMSKIVDHIRNQWCTVIVMHHWEFFQSGQPDLRRLEVLEELAGFLAQEPNVKVGTFDQVAASLWGGEG